MPTIVAIVSCLYVRCLMFEVVRVFLFEVGLPNSETVQ
jgi:hypothetical protein